MGIFSQPDTVNSRGDKLSGSDTALLEGGAMGGFAKKALDPTNIGLKLTPQQRGEMLYNWLTGGGPPKPVEPGKIFKEKQDISGVEAKASAGQGINSLFGIGKTIGDLTPKTQAVAPDPGTVSTVKMIEPLNQSPMQPGVPYSALPVGGK